MLEAFLPGVKHMQNIHPLVVHFPVAFLTSGALIYALSFGMRRESWGRAAFWFLALGALTAVLSAATGLYAEEGVMVAKSVRTNLLSAHKIWMLTTVAISVVLALWAAFNKGYPKKFRPLFVLLCLLMAAILAKGADYGGRMVYDYNAGGYACGQPIEFSK